MNKNTNPSVLVSHIVIDTNILFKDHRFQHRDLKKLIKTRSLYNFEICLPQVVYDELIGNFNRDFNSKLSQLTKSIDDINKSLSQSSEIDKKTIIKKLSRSQTQYRARLDKFIKEEKILIIPYPNISHQDIVKRMYIGIIPFGNEKCTEKGYKDFLIAKSVADYFEKIPALGKILLYTANFQDFTNSAKENRDRILEADKSLGVENLAIASSSSTLFQELSKNLKDKHKNDDVFKTESDVADKIRDAILSNFSIFDFDILKDFMLDLKMERVECTVLEYAVEVDEESEMMEVSGIVNIDTVCTFHVDEWDFKNIISPEFVFFKNIKNFVEDNGFSRRDNWNNEFKSLKNSSEFTFNYIDFDFKPKYSHKKLSFDPTFLSLSMI